MGHMNHSAFVFQILHTVDILYSTFCILPILLRDLLVLACFAPAIHCTYMRINWIGCWIILSILSCDYGCWHIQEL